jgi:hypothetical protein
MSTGVVVISAPVVVDTLEVFVPVSVEELTVVEVVPSIEVVVDSLVEVVSIIFVVVSSINSVVDFDDVSSTPEVVLGF